MKSISRRYTVLSSLLGVSGGIALAACGTTSEGVLPDASPDVAVDARTQDAAHDVTRADVGSPDSGHHDAGEDTGTADAGFDAGQDSGSTHDAGDHDAADHDGAVHDSAADAAHDVGVDAPRDAGFDALGYDQTFLDTVNETYCNHLSFCCVGTESSHFNLAGCIADTNGTDEASPLTNLGLIYHAQQSTHHTFNSTNAAACLSAITALACTTNTASDLENVINTCASAYVPGLAANETGCLSSFDCPSGTYCGPITGFDSAGLVPVVAAGGGTCLPLIAVGQPCMDDLYSSDCVYQGGFVNQAYCDGTVCQAPQALGTTCGTEQGQQCTSGQCGSFSTGGAFTCTDSPLFDWFYGTNQCTEYAQ